MAMAPVIARCLGPLDPYRSLLERRRAKLPLQQCNKISGTSFSKTHARSRAADPYESVSVGVGRDNFVELEAEARGEGSSSSLSRRKLNASLIGVSAAATSFAVEGLTTVFACPGIATAEVIYDKGAKLQGKVLSTRGGIGQYEGSVDAEAEKRTSSERAPPSLEATMIVPDRWKINPEPVVDTSDLWSPPSPSPSSSSSSSPSSSSGSGSRYTWSNFRDPITGGQTIERLSVEIVAAPVGVSDFSYLDRVYKSGTIESITASLPSDAKLEKADIFRANTRQDNQGITYYDWELAATPATCSEEERRVLGVCPYKSITLLSATFMNGMLVTLSIDSTVSNFQKYEKDIRNTVRTFSVSVTKDQDQDQDQPSSLQS